MFIFSRTNGLKISLFSDVVFHTFSSSRDTHKIVKHKFEHVNLTLAIPPNSEVVLYSH